MKKRIFTDEFLKNEINDTSKVVNGNYYVAFYDKNSDALLKIEDFYANELFQVIYIAENSVDIERHLSIHDSIYTLKPVKIWFQSKNQGIFTISDCILFTESLNFDMKIRYWAVNGSYVKEEYFDKNNSFLGCKKYIYASNNDLHYALEYDQHNKIYNCYDFLESQPIQLDLVDSIETITKIQY